LIVFDAREQGIWERWSADEILAACVAARVFRVSTASASSVDAMPLIFRPTTSTPGAPSGRLRRAAGQPRQGAATRSRCGELARVRGAWI
jgi:hypothetical protein